MIPSHYGGLQQNFLSVAEAALGARDTSKKIYQPGFTDDGPHVRNTPELDGALPAANGDLPLKY